MEFAIADCVFLKISPTQGVIRFGSKGKLSQRYIGPFEIMEIIGAVAYRLPLPPSLEGVHDIFTCLSCKNMCLMRNMFLIIEN